MALGAKLQAYKRLFFKLFPKGRLWRGGNDQPVFDQFVEASAQEFCRVDDRIKQLLLEIDPETTDEAIDQWQQTLGLPDECSPLDADLNEQRSQIKQKLTNIGGLSKQYYEFLGEQLGFDVQVNNYVNFVAGRARAGDPLTNYFFKHFVAGDTCGNFLTENGWLYYYQVDVPATASEHFVAGSTAGTVLREFSNELIECTMIKNKPAHSMPFFTFRE